MSKTSFGGILSAKRKELGMTLRELSSACHSDHTYLCKIEKNLIVPSAKLIDRLCVELKLDADSMFGMVGKVHPEVLQVIANSFFTSKLVRAVENMYDYDLCQLIKTVEDMRNTK